jgi:hypothetical protein
VTVLRGELPDRVPFTIYPLMLPRGLDERKLRERGLGFSCRTPVVQWEHPSCQVSTRRFQESGRRFERVTWTTPVGEVWFTNALDGAYGSTWAIDHPIRTRDDYRVLIFMAEDARPVPCYDEVRRLQQALGDDGYVIGSLGLYSPLMDIVVNLVGSGNFGYEMADNPDPFWSLYEALRGKARRAYPLAAQSPVHLVIYDGNIHPQVIGTERFARYILPCHEELAGLLHDRGKIIGTHLDADNRTFLDLVGSSSIDVIEAFTPPPDCSVRISEARDAWPRKIIWSNFPSSIHIAAAERVFGMTANLLAEAAPGDRFLIGITEDIPEDRWRTSLNAIADALDEFGITPIPPSPAPRGAGVGGENR